MNGVKRRDEERAHENQLAAERRSETQQTLHVLRQDHGRAEEHAADGEAERRPRGNGAIPKCAQIDDRPLRAPQFPDHERNEARSGENAERGDDRIAPPVVALAFVEDVLQRAQAQREQSEADEIQRQGARLVRISQPHQDDDGRDRTGNHVDEEDVVPRKIIGEPAAQCRTDRRTDDRAHREERLTGTQLVGGKRVAQRGLRGRDEAAAEQALNHAPKNQRRDRIREPAEDRRDREADDRCRVILPAAESHLQPRRERDDDDGRNDVAGHHPGAFVDGRAEIALDDRQRDIDDRGIERLHQRREHDPDRDDDERRAFFDDVDGRVRGAEG